jgi:hypothetical protein
MLTIDKRVQIADEDPGLVGFPGVACSCFVCLRAMNMLASRLLQIEIGFSRRVAPKPEIRPRTIHHPRANERKSWFLSETNVKHGF